MSQPVEGWKVPEQRSIAEHLCERFKQVRAAILGYARGDALSLIREQQNVEESELRRYIKRCLRPDGEGGILGFYGLLPPHRAPFTRSTPVASKRGRDSGLAGALNALIARFPNLIGKVRELATPGRGRRKKESRLRWRDLLELHLIPWLKEQGLGAEDWPLSQPAHGYSAFLPLFVACREGRLDEWLFKRFRRAMPASPEGTYTSLIPILLPYRIVEIDYQRFDAFSLIVVYTTPSGNQLSLVVERFWIGVAVEVRWQAVLACTLLLETAVSADGVLETLNDMIEPRPPLVAPSGLVLTCTPDGKCFPNQLYPEFAYHGVDLIRFDNAWANFSRDVVTAGIGVLGAAVAFGAIKQPKVRQTCERLIGKITQQGAQRVPSTTGTGPDDPRRAEPEAKALLYTVTVEKLAFLAAASAGEINATPNEGVHYASAFSLHAAAASGEEFLTTPLPAARREETRVLWYHTTRTIRGNKSQSEHPYVKWGRARMSSDGLRGRWDLIGKKAHLFVNRRDASICELVIQDTAEEIGRLKLPRKWRYARCSLKDRIVLERLGKASRDVSPRGNAVSVALANDIAEAEAKGGKGTKDVALRIARRARNAARGTPNANRQPQADTPKNYLPKGSQNIVLFPDATELPARRRRRAS